MKELIHVRVSAMLPNGQAYEIPGTIEARLFEEPDGKTIALNFLRRADEQIIDRVINQLKELKK